MVTASATASPFSQPGYGVRFDWGLAGAAELSTAAGATVVVDVLSFSTAVTIAVGRGTVVYPHQWPSPDAAPFAAERGAVCAVRRRLVDADHPWSLSPAHLLAAPAVERLVLPSPNGSTIAAAATGTVLVACLRNAGAVAGWLLERGFGAPGRPVSVVAAGERWPDGALRPALEDLLGSGAVIASLAGGTGGSRRGVAGEAHGSISPEAAAAMAVWRAHCAGLVAAMSASASGRELAEAGYQEDVALASELDVQGQVPLLVEGAFIDVATRPGAEGEGAAAGAPGTGPVP